MTQAPGLRPQAPGGKPRILIADDEQSMREWMRLLFQRDGFDVLTAEDGIDARDVVAREYVDVLLTDIRMPRLDGVGLAETVQQHIAALAGKRCGHSQADAAGGTGDQGHLALQTGEGTHGESQVGRTSGRAGARPVRCAARRGS